jgi:endogenous inhibitor of DNA gyrase (YacG/DUF329 family)
MTQPFHATNKPETCLWCGRKVPRKRRDWSYAFCTDGCGLRFGEEAARNGFRLKPKDTDPPKPKVTRTKFPKCPHCGTQFKSTHRDGSYMVPSGQAEFHCPNNDCSELVVTFDVHERDTHTARVITFTERTRS